MHFDMMGQTGIKEISLAQVGTRTVRSKRVVMHFVMGRVVTVTHFR